MNLWQRYNALPRRVRLYLGASTLVVAYVGGKASDYVFEMSKEQDLEKLDWKVHGEVKNEREQLIQESIIELNKLNPVVDLNSSKGSSWFKFW